MDGMDLAGCVHIVHRVDVVYYSATPSCPTPTHLRAKFY
jgi:hypothetical protein